MDPLHADFSDVNTALYNPYNWGTANSNPSPQNTRLPNHAFNIDLQQYMALQNQPYNPISQPTSPLIIQPQQSSPRDPQSPPEGPPITSSHASGTTTFYCWDHGCQGQKFSCSSNYRRHCREKSITHEKVVCQLCGQQFSRSTARNVHLTKGRCKVLAQNWQPDQTIGYQTAQ